MNKHSILSVAFLMATFFLALSFNAQGQAPAGYQLVFSDEFNGTTLSSNWAKSNCFTHGDELQVYKEQNVFLENSNGVGKLVLQAKKETVSNPPCANLNSTYNFSSGWVNSNPFLYGYFEVRAFLPGGCGAWPAIWFWSGTNDTQYSEIDVMEACGLHCNEYQAGAYEDDTDDGIANSHDVPQDHRTFNVDNACDDFNVYGLEWTPTELKFYFNHQLKFTYPNTGNHQPMSLILNLAIGNFNGCLDGCDIMNSEFPRYFLVDYVRVYKLPSDIVTLKPETTELCVGKSTKVYAPIYDGATYTWSTSDENGLKINPEYNSYINASVKPGFQGGWKTAKITGLAPGNYTVNLTITFPNGLTNSASIPIKVLSSTLAAPTVLNYAPQGGPAKCCYLVSTNAVPDASSYVWHVYNQNYPQISYDYESTTPNFNVCLPAQSTFNISVKAKNACAESLPLVQTYHFPPIHPCSDRWRMTAGPNPTNGLLEVSFIPDDEIVASQGIEGTLYVKDEIGNLRQSVEVNTDRVPLDLTTYSPGTYYLNFINTDMVLTTTVLKN